MAMEVLVAMGNWFFFFFFFFKFEELAKGLREAMGENFYLSFLSIVNP